MNFTSALISTKSKLEKYLDASFFFFIDKRLIIFHFKDKNMDRNFWEILVSSSLHLHDEFFIKKIKIITFLLFGVWLTR